MYEKGSKFKKVSPVVSPINNKTPRYQITEGFS